MTNRLALFLALLVVAFFALDRFVLHWNAPLFLARKIADLSDWLAFWH